MSLERVVRSAGDVGVERVVAKEFKGFSVERVRA